MPEKMLYTVKDVCRILGISTAKFYSIPEGERPPYIDIGPAKRYKKDDVYDWIDSRKRSK